MPQRVVFDCNVFVQGLISPTGPAGACLDAAAARQITAFSSSYVLSEVRSVASRPSLVARFGLTAAKTEQFIEKLLQHITLIENAPHVFSYRRDPKDEHYVNLAIATGSQLVVSRDRDLLALADPADPDGRDFLARYPTIRIITPVELLVRIETS